MFFLDFDYSQLVRREDEESKSKNRGSPKKMSTVQASREPPPPPPIPLSAAQLNDQSEEQRRSVSKSVSEDEPTSPTVQSPVAKSMSAVADKIASVLADSTETGESMRAYYGKISKSRILLNFFTNFLF